MLHHLPDETSVGGGVKSFDEIKTYCIHHFDLVQIASYFVFEGKEVA